MEDQTQEPEKEMILKDHQEMTQEGMNQETEEDMIRTDHQEMIQERMFEWLNKSFETFKVKCKELFLS